MKQIYVLLTFICISITLNAQGLTDSLIAYYPFNGNTNDSSGNNNNGTVNGPVLVADRFGNPNTAYHFDGIDDFIEIANSNSLDLGTNFSFSFWIYQDSAISTGYRVLDKNTAGFPDGYGIDTYGNSNGRVIRLYSGSTQNNMTTPHTLKAWTHVAITYDGSLLKFYLNGTQENSNSISAHNPPQNNLPLLIGCGQLGSSKQNFFKGSIDEVRIYGRALSVSDIQTLFTEKPLSVNEINSDAAIQNVVYPNPTSGNIYLSSANYVIEKITDITGKEIRIETTNTNIVNIVGAAALYFVHVKNTTTNQIQVIKINKI